MKQFCVILICAVLLHSVHSFLRESHPYPYYPPSKRQIFGEMTGERIGFQHETRWGFPFFTREALFVFPSEWSTDSPYDHYYSIRGIVHENQLDDDDCVPYLDIIEGGIFDRNATLKIVSKSGCGIDSKVSIYGEKAWRN